MSLLDERPVVAAQSASSRSDEPIDFGEELRGIFGRRLWDTWEQLTLLIESGRVDLSWLITHRLPLTQADHAIELLSADAIKILFLPSLT